MKTAVWFLCLFSAFVANADTVTHVVAETGGHSVLYASIACPAELRELRDQCIAAEQSRLNTIIIRRWIDSAASLHHLTLTDAEKSAIEAEVAARRDDIERVSKTFHALAVFALRIRRGEETSRVYESAAAEGISKQELDHELTLVPTLDIAERAAAQDYFAAGLQSMRDAFTRRIMTRRLDELIRRQATESHASFEDVEEQFWSDVAAQTHTAILDSTFRLPEKKGLLTSHEQTIQLHH